MSENTKLDPATLSAEERALWDTLAIRKLATGTLPENAYARSEGALIDLLKVRRALFGTATEKVKESKFPVGHCQVCGELVAPYNKHAKYEGGYTCQPAQPEPAAPDVFATDRAIGALAMNAEDAPAAPEMPEAVRSALLGLRLPVNEGVQFTPKEMNRRADALESWWRNSAQPVIGELDRLGAQIETAKLLLCNSEDREAILGELLKALTTLATVRQQAAQPPRLEKVRELIEECRSIASSYLRDKAYAALAELDAHEKGEGRG